MNSKQTEENYEEDESSDTDTCKQEELEALFNKDCKLLTSKKVLTNKYILHLDANKETDPSIVVASNISVDIVKYAQSQIATTTHLELGFEEECAGAKFAPLDNNIVYVACSKANIKMYDLRTSKKVVQQFVDTTVNEEGDMKTFLSFDISPDNKLLTAGTELFDGDAFVLFWDVRNANLLGGYWEGHTDDVIQVKFHAEDRNKLLSGSTDGLINMYNLREEKEDDALVEVLNTETSVEQVGWCGEDVFCATHTHHIQMWRLEDATPFGDFKREFLSECIKRKSDDYSYVAGCFMDKKQPVLMIGSNFKDGECLRALGVKKSELVPLFDCTANNQRVRALHFNNQTRILFTGGEKGIMDTWKLDNLS